MLCGLLCCHAMVYYGERESNDMLRARLLCYDTTIWIISFTVSYVVKNIFELIKMERMFLAIQKIYEI